MLKRVLLILVLISAPAWGDTLQFSSLANSWIEGSIPGSWDGYNAWYLGEFDVNGGISTPTSGAGTVNDPFRYTDSQIFLGELPPKFLSLGLFCDLPRKSFSEPTSVCASLTLKSITGYFSDPDTFDLQARVSGRVDPLIYMYLGLPRDYLDVVGELSLQLHYSGTSLGQRYFGGNTFPDSAMVLHPVPEPTTLLLFGTGIAAIISRKRMRP